MSSKPVKIFLVEDDLSFGSVLKSYLEINDFAVEWVDDGKYALDHFRKSMFDICILDVMLPHVDGFTIAGEIRQINSLVPIIFLTAKKMKDDVLKGYDVGGDDYITKPFDTDILLAKKYVQSSPEGISRTEPGIFMILANSYLIQNSGLLPPVMTRRSCLQRRHNSLNCLWRIRML